MSLSAVITLNVLLDIAVIGALALVSRLPYRLQSLSPRPMSPTSSAVLAADRAHLNEHLASVRWERRGPLQRLVKTHPDL
jgi:hypothetical protein